MDHLKEKLGYKTYEDLYQLTGEDVIKFGGLHYQKLLFYTLSIFSNFLRYVPPLGKTLLMQYKGSPSAIVCNVYPEHRWQLWRFVKTPVSFRNDAKLARECCEWFAAQKGITSLEDWYNVSSNELNGAGSTRFEIHFLIAQRTNKALIFFFFFFFFCFLQLNVLQFI
mgnify:CR=1 FL=1